MRTRRLLALAVALALGSACQSGRPAAGSLALVPLPLADQAITRAQRAVRIAPERAEAWTELARAFVAAARRRLDPSLYAQAREAIAQALDRSPDLAPARRVETMILLAEHRFGEAAARARALVAKDERDWVALGVLADAEVELGQYDAAIETVQRMLDGKPNQASYVRAGWLRWIDGDVAGAVAITRLAVAASSFRDPDATAFCATQLGALEWSRGRLGEADAAFRLALEALPAYASARIGRARVALARRRPADAVALLAKTARQSPTPEVLWVYGDALTAAGQAGPAEAAYRELEQVGPRIDPRTFALFAASTGRDLGRALSLAEEERRARDDIYTEDAFGWALLGAGRTAEAQRAAERALARGTPDPRLLFHAGMIARAAGQTGRARDLLRRALAANPAFEPEAAALAREALAGL